MSNTNTAQIVNSCFKKNMGIKEYLKAVFGLFVGNIKDIILLTLITQTAALVLSFLAQYIGIFATFGILTVQVIFIVSIIKLVDYKSKGENINCIQAIKRVKENWLMSTGAVIFQSFLLSIMSFNKLLPLMVTVFLAISIPIGALGNRTMLNSAVESFQIVKGNFLGVLTKVLLLTLITGVLIIPFQLMRNFSPIILVLTSIIATVFGTLQVFSSLVLFYNLTTKQ
ncbi:MAG: hypothetical protein ACRC57_00800 [Sarcina sp.]